MLSLGVNPFFWSFSLQSAHESTYSLTSLKITFRNMIQCCLRCTAVYSHVVHVISKADFLRRRMLHCSCAEHIPKGGAFQGGSLLYDTAVKPCVLFEDSQHLLQLSTAMVRFHRHLCMSKGPYNGLL